MLELSPIEAQSPIFQKLLTHYRQRLAALREKNDQRQESGDAEYLRGRIQEVKNFLDLQPASPSHLYIGDELVSR